MVGRTMPAMAAYVRGSEGILLVVQSTYAFGCTRLWLMAALSRTDGDGASRVTERADACCWAANPRPVMHGSCGDLSACFARRTSRSKQVQSHSSVSFSFGQESGRKAFRKLAHAVCSVAVGLGGVWGLRLGRMGDVEARVERSNVHRRGESGRDIGGWSGAW